MSEDGVDRDSASAALTSNTGAAGPAGLCMASSSATGFIWYARSACSVSIPTCADVGPDDGGADETDVSSDMGSSDAGDAGDNPFGRGALFATFGPLKAFAAFFGFDAFADAAFFFFAATGDPRFPADLSFAACFRFLTAIAAPSITDTIRILHCARHDAGRTMSVEELLDQTIAGRGCPLDEVMMTSAEYDALKSR